MTNKYALIELLNALNKRIGEIEAAYERGDYSELVAKELIKLLTQNRDRTATDIKLQGLEEDLRRCNIMNDLLPKLSDHVVIDDAADTISIHGITYAGDLFRTFGENTGTTDLLQVVKREDGVVTVMQYHDSLRYLPDHLTAYARKHLMK